MDWRSAVPYVNAVLLVIISGLGALIFTYLREKGKNLATHDDIAALTREVEVVKAEISDAMWNRQKHWELKREVLFEATKRIAEIDEALTGLHATTQIERRPDSSVWQELFSNKRDTWMVVSADFDKATELVAIVCEKETLIAFREFKAIANEISVAIIHDGNSNIYTTSQNKLPERLLETRSAIRAYSGRCEY